MNTDILKETIAEALEQVGETLTDKAINEIAKWVQILYENTELISPSPPNPTITEVVELKKQLEKETGIIKVCKHCKGHGKQVRYNQPPTFCRQCQGTGRLYN